MTEKRKKQFSIQVYLKPLIRKVFLAEKDMLMRAESEHASRIIEEHQINMSENNRQQLLKHYNENLTNKYG